MFNLLRSFPRAIIHVDGDCFFASVEIAQNPALKGKCVITGKERGIASSLSYEAKAMGVKRGMIISEIKKICPEAIILPSDYETYSIYSKRMFNIVRRYTPDVEESGIDECFADITGMRSVNHMSYEEMARIIKHELDTELGMTFSVGLAPSKTLAKVASKWKKPNGLTVISGRDIGEYLSKWPINKVWGIGPNTSNFLNKFGIVTAYDFINKSQDWIEKNLAKPYKISWAELRGTAILKFNLEEKHDYQSISKTRTFTPATNDKDFIFSELSKNVERACIKMRRHNLVSDQLSFFLKDNNFRYSGLEMKLSTKVSAPNLIVNKIKEEFEKIFNKKTLYRASGVTFHNLGFINDMQMDLFEEAVKSVAVNRIFEQIDKLNYKYGKHTVFLGSSLKPAVYCNDSAHKGNRAEFPDRKKVGILGENFRQRLNIPFLGFAK